MRKDDELRDRTKKYALRIIRMFEKLPPGHVAQTIGKQVLRSGTAVAANYREARRARTRREVRSKLGIVEQELDETQLWLELLVDSDQVSRDRMDSLLNETDELLRIVVASICKLKVPAKDLPG